MNPSDKEHIIWKLAGVLDNNRYPPSKEHLEAARVVVSLLQDKKSDELIIVTKNLIKLNFTSRVDK